MTATASGRPTTDPVVGVVAELRRALEALDAVIELRIEERQGGLRHRMLAVDADDEGVPPLDRYDGSGPLAATIGMAGLTAPEALVLVAAIAPHVDERFAASYGLLTDRPGVARLTGEVARTLMARTFQGRLDATAMLGERGALRASGLLTLDPLGDLDGTLVPDPGLVAWVLGQPAPTPHATAGFPARPLTTVHTLDDVVLAARPRARLGDLERRLAHREQVVERWGFARHHDNATGLVALFHGPPGTGKTMTAAAVAASAGLPAYVVDLSALVSKYIGETEKALAAVFERAEREGSLLVFDEADAVFGSRTEVTDSHDRYANQEVSYLLARIESHPGVVILTTNLLGNIDAAFRRRIHVMVEFPAPGPNERELLWERVLPPEAPTSGVLGLRELAETYQLTGAEIRDAAIEAAYLAAADDAAITRAGLEEGIRRQFAKGGRTARP
jgi:hypothetical protein